MAIRRLSLEWGVASALAVLLSGCGGGGGGAALILASAASYIPPIVGDWEDINDSNCVFNFVPSDGNQPLFKFTGPFKATTQDPNTGDDIEFQGTYNERQITLTAPPPPAVDANTCVGLFPAGAQLEGQVSGVDDLVFDNFTLTKSFLESVPPDLTTGVWVNQADPSHTLVFTNQDSVVNDTVSFSGCEFLGPTESIDLTGSVSGQGSTTLEVERATESVTLVGEFLGVSRIELSVQGGSTPIVFQREDRQGNCLSNP